MPAKRKQPRPRDRDERKRLRNRCGTMEEHRRLVRLDPEYRWRRRQIEYEVQEWTKRYAADGLRTGIIRIPVVVHVVWRTSTENISDAKIQSQLDVVNADFRRLNADATSTPMAFTGVAADARIEFALAVRDPNCAATTGITRTQTTVTGWTRNQTGMLTAAGGGHDPWDVTKYLNIWVVNYTDGLLGKGSFPGMPAAEQGVRCHYRAFGTVAPVDTPYHLGRTLTHEVGHYLNLLHIWGDDGTACTGSDQVDDTPNQADENYTPPTFPSISCSNGPNGDMFMNYMDYTDDVGMNMFTAGQSVRMDATLHTARASLLASDGLVPPPAGGVAGSDLWSKDVSDDIGAEPDASTQPMWISDDIWVRNANDGIANQDHQNPEYGSTTTNVYVRVRNRGCSGTSSGTVRLYWAKASSGLSWPAPWDGSVTAPALMGGSIGSQPVSVAGGDDEILTFPWSPPNPADYASFGADAGHFCLLSRIETGPAPGFGMTTPETGNLYANVQNNNNIVWKNITVVDEVSGRVSAAIIANFDVESRSSRLVFTTPKDDGPSIFDWGQVWFDMTDELFKLWKRAGGELDGVEQIDDKTFRVRGPGASLGPFKLRSGDFAALQIRFVPHGWWTLGARVLTLDLEQVAEEGVIGGQRFVVKTKPDRRGVAIDRPETTFDGVGWVPTGHGGGGRCCCC